MSNVDDIRKFRESRSDLTLGIEHFVGVDMYEFIIKNGIKSIVETGIAHGFSSWYFLEALEVTNGVLYSLEAAKETTVVVPERLRGRWKRRYGLPASPESLVNLFSEIKTADLFWHDSDHTFGVQFGEYVIASHHCKYIGSHDIETTGAWTAFLDLYKWREVLRKHRFGVSTK